MKWFFNLFENGPKILKEDFCNGKTDKELLECLKNGFISVSSGNMILLELIERILIKLPKD